MLELHKKLGQGSQATCSAMHMADISPWGP